MNDNHYIQILLWLKGMIFSVIERIGVAKNEDCMFLPYGSD